MSQETNVTKSKNTSYPAIGLILGAGLALLLSQLGVEMEMSVGMVLGLCIGTYIDKRN